MITKPKAEEVMMSNLQTVLPQTADLIMSSENVEHLSHISEEQVKPTNIHRVPSGIAHVRIVGSRIKPQVSNVLEEIVAPLPFITRAETVEPEDVSTTETLLPELVHGLQMNIKPLEANPMETINTFEIETSSLITADVITDIPKATIDTPLQSNVELQIMQGKEELVAENVEQLPLGHALTQDTRLEVSMVSIQLPEQTNVQPQALEFNFENVSDSSEMLYTLTADIQDAQPDIINTALTPVKMQCNTIIQQTNVPEEFVCDTVVLLNEENEVTEEVGVFPIETANINAAKESKCTIQVTEINPDIIGECITTVATHAVEPTDVFTVTTTIQSTKVSSNSDVQSVVQSMEEDITHTTTKPDLIQAEVSDVDTMDIMTSGANEPTATVLQQQAAEHKSVMIIESSNMDVHTVLPSEVVISTTSINLPHSTVLQFDVGSVEMSVPTEVDHAVDVLVSPTHVSESHFGNDVTDQSIIETEGVQIGTNVQTQYVEQEHFPSEILFETVQPISDDLTPIEAVLLLEQTKVDIQEIVVDKELVTEIPRSVSNIVDIVDSRQSESLSVEVMKPLQNLISEHDQAFYSEFTVPPVDITVDIDSAPVVEPSARQLAKQTFTFEVQEKQDISYMSTASVVPQKTYISRTDMAEDSVVPLSLIDEQITNMVSGLVMEGMKIASECIASTEVKTQECIINIAQPESVIDKQVEIDDQHQRVVSRKVIDLNDQIITDTDETDTQKSQTTEVSTLSLQPMKQAELHTQEIVLQIDTENQTRKYVETNEMLLEPRFETTEEMELEVGLPIETQYAEITDTSIQVGKPEITYETDLTLTTEQIHPIEVTDLSDTNVQHHLQSTLGLLVESKSERKPTGI